ncbi:MAG: FtsX-like permease family protein, partial [Anaerolineales bacterium]|nr:FtsX-like permease family protein [Anaerolineales bacterium]
LNIVAAIRDLADPPRPPTFLRDRLLAPFRAVADGFRALFRLRVFRALRAWLVGLPGSVWRLIWLGFTSGPLTLGLGLLLFPYGLQQAVGWAYSIGASFVLLGGGLTLRGLLRRAFRPLARRWPRVTPDLADRLAFTLAGGLLALFWSLPFGFLEERLGVPEMSSGPEMLFISGILLVTGAVLVVMYNTDLLLRLVLLGLGGAAQLRPVLRMAVAYPLANRFRTGLTVGIFAVVVFSVVFMATAFKVNDVVLQDTESFTGGWDLRVSTSRANPIDDLAVAIARQSALRRADYAVVAAQTTAVVEVRQEGLRQTGTAAADSARWKTYYVQALDDAFLENIDYDLGIKAEGYATAADVWRAVRDNPGYAVIDRLVVPSRQTTNIVIGGPDFRLEGVYLEDKTMPPLKLQVRDPATQATLDVTVIGVLEQSALTGFGLMVGREAVAAAMPDALPAPVYYIRLAPGVDPAAASAGLESAFLKQGLEAVDQVQELRDGMRTQLVFQQLLLGFLTLGLVVGVAALGVISTRAVVERRQQIGMLRALGFRREMVAWSFLIESSFVALLGIGLGITLGLIPAYNMIVSMAAEIPGITF